MIPAYLAALAVAFAFIGHACAIVQTRQELRAFHLLTLSQLYARRAKRDRMQQCINACACGCIGAFIGAIFAYAI